MPIEPSTRRAGLRALIVVVTLGSAVVAARPGSARTVTPSVAPVVAANAGAHPASPQGGVIVQVRDFPSSATLSIVAWNAAAPAYGLSTVVSRSGRPDQYHRLWVNQDWPGGRDVKQAQGLDRPLKLDSLTDTQNCFNGKCTPTSTFRARILDGQMRGSKGDVPVKFITNSGSEIVFTLRRDLVDAYLGTIDSVVAALKK